MYVAANFPQASMLAPTAETFRQFLEQQGVFIFFITIFTGAGLIANDLRANALQIYLSKPLGRVEYIAGKFAVLAFFLLLVTWLPATMLLVIQIVFAGNLAFLKANLFLLPAILVATGHRDHRAMPRDAGALVALEERAVCRHHVRRHDVLHPRPLRRRLRGDPQHEVLLDVAHRATCSNWAT